MLYGEDGFSHTKYESASYYESPYRKAVDTIDSCLESVQNHSLCFKKEKQKEKKLPPQKFSEA